MTTPDSCPSCGEPIGAVTAIGPDHHRAQPCGHRLPPDYDLCEGNDGDAVRE